MMRRERDERGVSAIFVCVLIVVLLTAAAFSVDLGMQRVVRRDMQAVSDVVALDLARQLDGRTKGALMSSGDLEAALTKSVARNTSNIGDTPEVSFELGKLDSSGDFVSIADSAVPTVVRVSSKGTVGFAFGGITGVGSGSATRSAVAQAEVGACYTLGTYAARIRLGDGTILGPLIKALGTDVGLNVLDAKGLADADIKLVDLVGTGLVAGGFDQLVDANVTLGSFYLAMAKVLEAEGGQAAQVTLLKKLATVAAKDVVLNVGDIVGIDSTTSAGLAAVVNVFDLVTAAAFVANGQNAVSVPSLNVGVPGLSSLSGNLKIGQKPIQRCGRARSAQTKGLSSQVEVNLSGNLANLNLGVVSISAPITLTLKLTPAEADLDDVACLSPKKRLDFLVTSGLVSLDITIGDPSDKNDLSVKALLGLLPLVDGYIRLYTSPTAAQTEAKSITVDSDDYDGAAPAEFGSNSLGVPNLHQDSHLNVLGVLPAGGLLGAVVTPLLDIVVNPLVQTLDSALLSPLLQALGINVAGADVYARPKADCGIPSLVG